MKTTVAWSLAAWLVLLLIFVALSLSDADYFLPLSVAIVASIIGYAAHSLQKRMSEKLGISAGVAASDAVRSALQHLRIGRPSTWSDLLAKRRGIAAVMGTGFLAAGISIHAALTGRLDGGILLIAFAGVGIVMLDLALLWWRITSGVYGSNRVEAEELLTLIARRSGKDGDPPRRAVRDPLEARETEPARPEGAVAGAET